MLILTFLTGLQELSAQKKPNPVSSFDSVQQLSAAEKQLSGMINDFRLRNSMTAIALSPKLCKVATLHAADLIYYKPAEKGCTLQSWSDSGNWKPCCALKDQAGMACMKSKPKEITGYPGDGYELVYWTEEEATADDVAAFWLRTTASQDMILGRGKWASLKWKAMGIAIQNGYALLWLGDKSDTPKPINEKRASGSKSEKPENTKIITKANTSVKSPSSQSEDKKTIKKDTVSKLKIDKVIAKADTVVKNKPKEKAPVNEVSAKSVKAKKDTINKPKINKDSKSIKLKIDSIAAVNPKTNIENSKTGNDTVYYVVTASVSNKAQALAEAKKLKSQGYKNATVIADLAVYRIVIFQSSDQRASRNALNEYRSKFKGAWIWRKHQ